MYELLDQKPYLLPEEGELTVTDEPTSGQDEPASEVLDLAEALGAASDAVVGLHVRGA